MNTGHETIEIKKVTSEKDLGVIIDQSLNFSKHINEKVNKANRNFGIIFRAFTNKDWHDMFRNLYCALHNPCQTTFEICTPLFKKGMMVIENVLRRATKLVSSVKNLSYPERLRKLGFPSHEYTAPFSY